MSQENVEIAWRASNAWNEGGIEALLAYLDPEIDAEWAWPIKMRDGKGIEVRIFTDRAQALAAAGLSE